MITLDSILSAISHKYFLIVAQQERISLPMQENSL